MFGINPKELPYKYRKMRDRNNEPLSFPHVFKQQDGVNGYSFAPLGVIDHVRTIAEQRMCELSAALRSKPAWWTKYQVPDIRAKWRAEALQQTILDGHLTEAEVDYVLDELQGYDGLRHDDTGAQVSCFDRIWQSDSLVSGELRLKLISEIAKLEDIPEEKKDWHPRSNNLVLDLVHPSLYCLVYGRTRGYPENADREPGMLKIITQPPTFPAGNNPDSVDPYSISKQFAWIPTDFTIAEGGLSAKARSYINNLYPKHVEVYSALESLVAQFSHLFDRVLTDLHPKNPLRRRISDTYSYSYHEEEPDATDGKYDDEWRKRLEKWNDNKSLVLPSVPEGGYPGDLGDQKETYSIQGNECQIIIKLANIHLTPEKPKYNGGSWHIEGMANERIVASGIYYYSSDNVSTSQLAFRESVALEDHYEQWDDDGVKATWGLQKDMPCCQDLGAVDTIEGRCVAFPNIYQHRVSSFELIDSTKPGHRKIIALFLVDPLNRIPSTTTIPPQQSEWLIHGLNDAPPDSLLGKLPAELLEMIAREVDTTMTENEAKDYREELMDERTQFIGENDENFFSVGFNLCEH